MKHISINIPTSLGEVKMMWKERTDERYKHNRQVLINLYDRMLSKMKSNYWSNDVSEYFRNNFETSEPNGCKGLLNDALKELQ